MNLQDFYTRRTSTFYIFSSIFLFLAAEVLFGIAWGTSHSFEFYCRIFSWVLLIVTIVNSYYYFVNLNKGNQALESSLTAAITTIFVMGAAVWVLLVWIMYLY